MNGMNSDEFRCAACGQVFEKAWSDAECDAEAAQVFPGIPSDEMCVVCDDCYRDLMGSSEAKQ